MQERDEDEHTIIEITVHEGTVHDTPAEIIGGCGDVGQDLGSDGVEMGQVLQPRVVRHHWKCDEEICASSFDGMEILEISPEAVILLLWDSQIPCDGALELLGEGPTGCVGELFDNIRCEL